MPNGMTLGEQYLQATAAGCRESAASPAGSCGSAAGGDACDESSSDRPGPFVWSCMEVGGQAQPLASPIGPCTGGPVRAACTRRWCAMRSVRAADARGVAGAERDEEPAAPRSAGVLEDARDVRQALQAQCEALQIKYARDLAPVAACPSGTAVLLMCVRVGVADVASSRRSTPTWRTAFAVSAPRCWFGNARSTASSRTTRFLSPLVGCPAISQVVRSVLRPRACTRRVPGHPSAQGLTETDGAGCRSCAARDALICDLRQEVSAMKQREAQLAKSKDEVAQGTAERKRLHDRVASLNQAVSSLQQLNAQVSPCMASC